MINQAVGDAMSGLLLCFAILSLRNMTFDDWCGLYTDLPSKQCKIDCAAKASIICSEDETQVVAPEGLQAALNEAMKRRGAKSRCFVRPSGTEDCVRIYAEAKTQADANLLAEDAAAAIRKFLG